MLFLQRITVFIQLYFLSNAWKLKEFTYSLKDTQCISIQLWHDQTQSIPDIIYEVEQGCQGESCCGGNLSCLQRVSSDGRVFYPNLTKDVILCFGRSNVIYEIDVDNIRGIPTTITQRAGHRVYQYHEDLQGITRKYVVILGGKLSDGSFTDEVLRYEVAWAPMYYYGNSPDKGHAWIKMDPLITTLANFALTKKDDENLVYVHGGLVSDNQPNAKLFIYENFKLSEVTQKKITKVTQSYQLWDRQISLKTYDQSDYANFFTKILFQQQNHPRVTIESAIYQPNCDISASYPPCMKDHIMLYNEDCKCIFFFSDQYYILTILRSADNWVFLINDGVWTKVNQMSKPQSHLFGLEFCIQFQHYLSFSSGKIYFFDPQTLQWQQIERKALYNSELWPEQLVGPQVVISTHQIFLIDNNRYYYTSDEHIEHGQVQYGLAKCDEGWKGVSCEQKMCPGACFQQLPQESLCFECYGNGECQNGQCKCKAGFSGYDCSQMSKCPNDCSLKTFGGDTTSICIDLYPIKQCRCPESQKRGADDCSVIFCLNDCSGNGKCESGSCQCNQGYIGEDCSILGIVFLENMGLIISLILQLYVII